MFDRLKALFGGPAPQPAPDEPLAAALLLLELARADFETAEVEQAKVAELLAHRYGLDPAQTQVLMQRARSQARAAVSLYDYVRTLNERLDAAGKQELMSMLWQVAYADGRLDMYEEQLLRKLAELLYIPNEIYIRTKLAARGETGVG
jgi:uncharacterized tellurite resistance protein B-like protein